MRIASFDHVAAFQACPEFLDETPMTVELPSAEGTVRVIVVPQAVPAPVVSRVSDRLGACRPASVRDSSRYVVLKHMTTSLSLVLTDAATTEYACGLTVRTGQYLPAVNLPLAPSDWGRRAIRSGNQASQPWPAERNRCPPIPPRREVSTFQPSVKSRGSDSLIARILGATRDTLGKHAPGADFSLNLFGLRPDRAKTWVSVSARSDALSADWQTAAKILIEEQEDAVLRGRGFAASVRDLAEHGIVSVEAAEFLRTVGIHGAAAWPVCACNDKRSLVPALALLSMTSDPEIFAADLAKRLFRQTIAFWKSA